MTTTQNAARLVLTDLAESREVRDLLERLKQVQRETEADATWATPLGMSVEAAMDHLRMAIEAADPRAFQH